MTRIRELLEGGSPGSSDAHQTELDRLAGRAVAFWYGLAAEPPGVDEVRDAARTRADGAVELAAAGARAAVVTFDGTGLASWVLLLDGLAETGAPGANVVAPLHRGFAALLASDAEAAAPLFDRAGTAAMEVGWGAPRIEAVAGEALVALEFGRVDDAVSLARRAWRMARSEELPHLEVLVALVLARVRRHAGAPHLASRILRLIAELAPPVWSGWLRWEALLAGTGEVGDAHGAASPAVGASDGLAAALASPPVEASDAHGAASPAVEASDALAAALASAGRGDRESFEREADRAAEALAHAAPLRAELADVRALVDLRAPASSPAVAAFRRRETEAVPRGLHGLSPSSPDPEAQAIAYVIAPARDRAQRVLHLGLALCTSADTVLLTPELLPGMRTAAAVVALLESGRAPSEEHAFFRALYGFDFNPAAHRGVLDTLLHRVRAAVDGIATLERGDGRLSLELRRDVIVWDPSCTSPLADRLLRLLASEGPRNPDEAAERLGYSRRAVYDALKRLVEEGACRRDQIGRRVAYGVEDSAFSDPTRARFEHAKRA